jgi:hypothetical protein
MYVRRRRVEEILGVWSGDDGIRDTRVENVQLMELRLVRTASIFNL